jgi:aquaporin Z
MQATEQIPATARTVSRFRWPEYFIEAAALGIFMISACVFTVLLEHPSSPVHQAIENGVIRRMIMGAAMGLTSIALVSSAWGRRSGAHMNPAITLSFLALGKVDLSHAVFYVLFQFTGGLAGVFLAMLAIGSPLVHSAVNFAATVPGPRGTGVAFAAEFVISAVMMAAILLVSNSRRLARHTPLFAGGLVATYITFEAPLSGMSMNPARTLGSAYFADEWTALWIYFTAPLLGMLCAAALYRLGRGTRAVFCAKLHMCDGQNCLFRCRSGELHAR